MFLEYITLKVSSQSSLWQALCLQETLWFQKAIALVPPVEIPGHGALSWELLPMVAFMLFA